MIQTTNQIMNDNDTKSMNYGTNMKKYAYMYLYKDQGMSPTLNQYDQWEGMVEMEEWMWQ